MRYTPPPPPLADGVLTVTVAQILAGLVRGIVDGCVMCQHSTLFYWPHERRYHPLHPGCALRLVERWYTMLDETQDGAEPIAAAPSGLTGAYARRAAKMAASGAPAAAPVVTRSLAPEIPDDVAANRWWRPGNGPDEPWIVQIERTTGRSFVPFGANRERAYAELSRQQLLASRDDMGTPGVVTLGARVIFPDGCYHDPGTEHGTVWGEVSDPHDAPLFLTIERVIEWTKCNGCGEHVRSGRFVVAMSRLCRTCAEPGDDGRPWPVEPDDDGSGPPVKVKRKQAKRDAVAVD